MARLTAPAGLTSASAEFKPAEKIELISEATEFLDISATAARTFNTGVVLQVVWLGFGKCDSTIVTSVFLR